MKSSSVVLVNETQQRSSEPGAPPRVLTETDAIEIWIARWLRIRRKELIAQYGCDSRRLYEIWWGERFPRSKDKAAALFRERYPGLIDRTAFGYRRIPRGGSKAGDDRQQTFQFD